MDEATSQIDAELDDQVRTGEFFSVDPLIFRLQIQQTVRDEFNGAIVVTIAHRLKTVLDYDRILVLGGGEILEFDTPQSLIRKQGGVFRQMCKASSDWPLLQRLVQAGNVTEGGSS